MRLSDGLRIILATFIGTAVSGPCVAAAEPVYMAGDEVLAAGTPQLEAAFQAAGLNIAVVDGSVDRGTARRFAITQPEALSSAIAAEGDVEVMFLSIGLYDLQRQPDVVTAPAAFRANVRTILDRVLADHPDVQVLVTGYPLPNFVDTPACRTQAEAIFGADTTPSEINSLFVSFVNDSLQAAATAYAHVTFIPVLDTLQVAAGMTPDLTAPSPQSFLQSCVQPNAAGMDAIMSKVVADYWLGFAMPTVDLVAPAGSFCPGDTIEVESASTNTTRRIWRVDGQPADTTAATLRLPAPAPTATIEISLTVLNGPWRQSDSISVTVAECPDAGVPMDAGAPADAAAVVDAGPLTGPELQISSGCRSAPLSPSSSGLGLWLGVIAIVGRVLRRRC